MKPISYLTEPNFRDCVPRPFPGTWPTRLAWSISYRENSHLDYLGKPTREQSRRFSKLLGQLPGIYHYNAVEFDRTHILASYTFNFELQVHPHLFSFYHLWQTASPYLSHLEAQTYRRRLAGHIVYMPFRTLSAARRLEWNNYVQETLPSVDLSHFLVGTGIL